MDDTTKKAVKEAAAFFKGYTEHKTKHIETGKLSPEPGSVPYDEPVLQKAYRDGWDAYYKIERILN